MAKKLSLYKWACWINAILLIIFALLVFYLTFEVNSTVEQDDSTALIFILIGVFIYCINDFLGINLTNKARRSEMVTNKRFTLILIFYILECIFQLFLAFLTYYVLDEFVSLLGKSQSANDDITGAAIVYLMIVLIFVSSLFHIIFTFPIIKYVRKLHNEMNESIRKMGSQL